MKVDMGNSQPGKRRIPVLAVVAIVWVGIYLVLKLVIKPPLPSSLVFMYMSLTSVGVLIALSIYEDVLHEVTGPIVDFLRGDQLRSGGWRLARWALLLVVPVYIGFLGYQRVAPRFDPPIASRVIHPAPPPEVMGSVNPLRREKDKLPEYIAEGKQIFYKNCVFCHGDHLNGKGIFAIGLNLPPANFVDPGTIAQLQESYVFWRVSEGGPGLPQESTPWDSAMPRWADMLSEQDRWKVILFLYQYTGYTPRTWEASARQATPAKGPQAEEAAAGNDQEQGKKIYEKHCSQCHGLDGDGNGPAAERLWPRPRDFRNGLFKIRSTVGGLPSDQDLFRTITNGMPGTAMPAWGEVLKEQERSQVVSYIKTFSRRFERLKEPPKPLEIGPRVPSSADSIAKGKELFRKIECFKCHGDDGRANGPSAPELTDDWGYPIRPANLRKPWNFRGGHAPEDLYRRLRIGISGTPMPSFADSLDNEQTWHLINYVRSLWPDSTGDRPPLKVVLRARQVKGAIPSAPDDAFWQSVEPSDYPLIGQVIKEPRLFTPSVDMIQAQVVYNASELAFRLVWDDPTHSQPDSAAGIFEDAVAVQLPVKISSDVRRPFFLLGDEELGVHLLRWSDTGGADGTVTEMNAHGVASVAAQPAVGQQTTAAGEYVNGQYRVVMKRPLTTADADDIQPEPGKFIPIGFFVWDGSNKETGAQMAISHWYYLLLQQDVPPSIYAVPVVVIGLTGVLEWWLVRRLRAQAAAGRT
jgi:cbb3-type cytochrome c oxidase subunit III